MAGEEKHERMNMARGAKWDDVRVAVFQRNMYLPVYRKMINDYFGVTEVVSANKENPVPTVVHPPPPPAQTVDHPDAANGWLTRLMGLCNERLDMSASCTAVVNNSREPLSYNSWNSEEWDMLSTRNSRKA
jgi:hypothetical protein